MITEIARPSNYPECSTCPEVQKIIDSWLNFKPTLPYQYVNIKSISVHCRENDGNVSQLNECLSEIQFLKNKKVLEIPGGNIREEMIECPHFVNKSGGR